jgi:pimeloyl-ACP methyl ester carboxylesterase
MIENARGAIDYDECGTGPTIVLVPGSCSTGAAWRPVVSHWHDFRCVTTSPLGYGRTAERRTAADANISYEAEVVESVVARTGGPVHLVGHSFCGLTALAVALRHRFPLLSLVIIETPAPDILRSDRRASALRVFPGDERGLYRRLRGRRRRRHRVDDRLLWRLGHTRRVAGTGWRLRTPDDRR